MRYKLLLPNQTEMQFDHAAEGRQKAYEAGLLNVRLWVREADGSWYELSQHAIQAVFVGG